MIATEFVNWQEHQPVDDSRFARCSPNLEALRAHMVPRFGLINLGCYAARPIRGGTAPSSHAFGAAIDLRYIRTMVVPYSTADLAEHAARRQLALEQIIPFLIDNSFELRIQAIHDYVGQRIWRAGRTTNTADAHTRWWLKQNKSNEGMGQLWAGWLHIETNLSGWSDGRPVVSRLPTPATPVPATPATPESSNPAPAPIPEEDSVTIGHFIPDADAGFTAEFIGMCTADGVALHLEWTGPGADPFVGAWLQHLRDAPGGLRKFPITLGGLGDVVLDGMLPHGDPSHRWTGREFRRTPDVVES